jgi:hypothetical protein
LTLLEQQGTVKDLDWAVADASSLAGQLLLYCGNAAGGAAPREVLQTEAGFSYCDVASLCTAKAAD